MIKSSEAVRVISQHRNQAIVVATMTARDEWTQLPNNPDLDLGLGGCMGKASSLGLGLALALPAKKVIVLDTDGSLLMNLGSLVTIANMSPPNLIHFVFENSVYYKSGSQPIPNAGKLSFTGLAKEAGYANVHECEELEGLENDIETMLNQMGPTFVCLKVLSAAARVPFSGEIISKISPQFKLTVQTLAR